MDAPTIDHGAVPSIKCSSCGRDMDMAGLAEHQCASTFAPASSIRPPAIRKDSSTSLRSMRSQRPLLLKIDPSLGFRLPAYQGELTPASSGHNSLASPVSASSGSRSPWPTSRKGSLPGPRRPPSPELSNLDCAFPPFPLPSRASTTKKRDRSGTHRNETKRSRSREAQKEGKQSNRRPTLAREGSSNNHRLKSSDTLPTLKQSRPTSPLSNEVKPDNHQETTETAPVVPFESLAAKAFLPDTDASAQPSIWNVQSQAVAEKRMDPSLDAFDFGGAVADKAATSAPEPGTNDRVRAETEPAYKSKRPPPILSNREILPLTKSPTAPQPSPSGSFFGRLLRRRSQSAINRRNVARQALSDEPETLDKYSAGHNILSPDSDRSFTAEPSPLGPSPPVSPQPAPSHEESQDTTMVAKNVAEDVAIVPTPIGMEPSADMSKRSGQILPFNFDVMVMTEPTDASEHVSTPDGSELIEALRRVSIDSASSYGSIGFSERTTSSRSTAPQVDITPIDAIVPADSSQITFVDVDVPAPLRRKVTDISVDSPTDPLFQQGRLSPIPAPAHQPRDSLESIPATQVEQEPSSEAVQEAQFDFGPTVKPPAPNKGTCRGCSQLILPGQKSVSSADGRLTGRYHKECFVCQACKTTIPTAEFYVHNDHPYCGQHYHELENSLCATCGQGIEGLYMETANVAGRGKEKHHPECLKCTTCKTRLDHDYFELSGKVYCERDAFRLAMLPKSHDNAPSRPSPLIREYISSGDPGLIKGRNFPERRTNRLMTMA